MQSIKYHETRHETKRHDDSERNTETTAYKAGTAKSNERHENRMTTLATPPGRSRRAPKPTTTTTNRSAGSMSKADKKTKKDKYAIRRILAEKRAIAAKGGKQYLIDWFPSWEPAANLKTEDDIVKEWNMNKKSYTFQYGSKKVAKCENPTSDEAEEQCRLMFDTVVNEMQKFLLIRGHEEVAKDLFLEGEWIFGNNKEKDCALEKAEAAGDPEPTAAEVMRETFVAIRKQDIMSVEGMRNLTYGDICVRYLGQVDDKFPLATGRQDRTYTKVKALLSPLCHPALHIMEPENWEKEEEMHVKLKGLDEVARLFVTRSPFLLKKVHVWPLFFTRLFLMSDEIEEMLKKIGLTDRTSPGKIIPDHKTSEDWPEETRDWFLQSYSAAFDWEARAVENIERTCLYCRDLITDRVLRVPKPKSRRNKTKKNVKGGQVIMPMVESLQESHSEDDSEEKDPDYESESDRMDLDAQQEEHEQN